MKGPARRKAKQQGDAVGTTAIDVPMHRPHFTGIFVASTILKPYETRKRPGLFSRAVFVSMLVFAAIVYGLMAVILPIQMLPMMMTPFFIVIAIILWMLPDVGGVQINRIQSLLVAFIGYSVAWPNYVAFNLPGLPWITPTRIALFWLVSVFVINFSSSREMRDALRDSVSEMPGFMKVFWFYWLATTVAMVFSDDFAVSINRYINNQIYWTMMFFATALAASRAGFVMRLSKMLLYTTVIVLIYSLYEVWVERVIWVDHLPSFLKIDPEVLQSVMDAQSRAGTDIYRARGPYVVALYFSEFLSMAFPFFVHSTAQERRFWPFVLLLAATFGMMVLMYMTNTRSAMIGMIVAIVAYPLFIAAQALARKRRSIVGSAIIYGYPAVLVVVALIVQFWNRAHVLVLGGGQHQSSSDARSAQWEMMWPKLATHPLGHGVGRGNTMLGFLSPSGKGTVDSYYITVMMDSGVLALPLFILLFLVPAIAGFYYFRTAKTPEMKLLAPFALGLVNFSIIKSVLSTENTVPLAFVFIGCIVGLVYQHKRPSRTVAAPAAPAAQPILSSPRRPVPALAGRVARS